MAYLVLARKWRPQTFSEVVGQEHITITLENAIKKDRIASAYLFSGPRGVGKTTTARILAKALNCEEGPTTQPCNACVACREISESRSMDVLEIDGASNRGIDEVRSLRESTRYTPSNLRYKIYIIDEVHMLTTEAFNALLKTLEEPPSHVIFIFATTLVNKVPSTILSRCQRFDFRRISAEKIIAQLEMICQNDKIQIDKAALYLIAKKADGCMRDSESLLDQVVSYCGNSVKEEEVVSLLGLINQDIYFEMTQAISDRNVAGLLELAQKIYHQGFDIHDLIAGLAEHFHSLLVLKSTHSKEHLKGFESFFEDYEKAVSNFDENDLIRMIQIINEVAFAMRRSSNAQLQFESLLVRLAKLPPSVELQKLFVDLHELKKKASRENLPGAGLKIIPEVAANKLAGSLFNRINGTPQTEGTGENEQPVADDPVDQDESFTLEDIREAWPAIIETVKKKRIHIGALLEEGNPVRLIGNQLEVAFAENNGFHIHTLNEHRRLIEGAIRDAFHKRVLIHCVQASKLPDSEKTHEAKIHTTGSTPEIQNEPIEPQEDWLSEFPMARKLIENLGGEPVD